MCTSIILFRKKNLWPVIIGTNRDERLDRKSLFPNRYWKEKYPNIHVTVGGNVITRLKDEFANCHISLARCSIR